MEGSELAYALGGYLVGFGTVRARPAVQVVTKCGLHPDASILFYFYNSMH